MFFVAAAYCIMVLKLYRKLLSLKQKKETDILYLICQKKNFVRLTPAVNKSKNYHHEQIKTDALNEK